MTEDKALAVREDMSLADTLTLGKVMAESGFFPDTKTAAQAVVKILAGREIGVGPFASMVGVSIIQGKPAIGANLLASKVKDSGRYDYRVSWQDDEHEIIGCAIDFFEQGKKIGQSIFTLADAKTAGLVDKQNWRSFRRNMLFARAISNGVRWYCPNVTTMPVYTPDELGAMVNDDGDVIDVQPTRTEPRHGPEWKEGIGEQPEPTSKPEPTLAEVFQREDKPQVANGKAHEPMTAVKLLTLVNERTGDYYKAPQHLMNAVRLESGQPEWDWPHPDDRPAWIKAFNLALSHAKKQAATLVVAEAA